MLISMLSRALSVWFAFFLPSFHTFKALSRRPVSEPELEKWGMYWAVLGTFIAFEFIAKPLISWVLLHWQFDTLFLLFISLPQTQGSTYIYTTYLCPFFVRNEQDLEAGILSAQRYISSFLRACLSMILAAVSRTPRKSVVERDSTPRAPE